jgi:hypothetical protein
MSQLIIYLKNTFKEQFVFSLPTAIFEAGCEVPAADAPPRIGDAALLEALADKPLDGVEPAGSVYFRIVDARPESKFKIRVAHMVKKRTEVRVQILNHAGLTDTGEDKLALQGPGRSLDMINYCHIDKFKEILSSLRRYVDVPYRMELTLCPLLQDGSVLPILQPPRWLGVADDEPLLVLLPGGYVGFDAGAAAPPTPGAPLTPDAVPSHASTPPAPEAAAPVTPVGGLAVIEASPEDQLVVRRAGVFSSDAIALAQWLANNKVWAENDSAVFPWTIPRWSQAAETELVQWGMVEIREDEFGDRSLALKLECTKIEGSVSLAETHMACNRWAPYPGSKLSKFGRLELVFQGPVRDASHMFPSTTMVPRT